MLEQQESRVRVALADDEHDLRRVLVGLVERLGHHVVYAAADGAELLDACKKEDVDVVLVDLDMPVVDGLAAAEVLSGKGVPVVLISGHPDVMEIVVEHEPIVTRVLKPVTLENLRLAICEALSHDQ